MTERDRPGQSSLHAFRLQGGLDMEEHILAKRIEAQLPQILFQQFKTRGTRTERKHLLVGLVHADKVNPHIAHLVVPGAIRRLHRRVVEHVRGVGRAEGERVPIDLLTHSMVKC